MHVHRTNFKVLIADDHFMTRQMVGNVLQKRHIINVVMVSNGQEAIDTITGAYEAKAPFHIIFLDWDMPGVAGLDVLKHFRKQKEYAKTAFVMLTANSQQRDVLEAVKAGATAYIIKPAAPTQVDEKFLEVCEWVRKNEA